MSWWRLSAPPSKRSRRPTSSCMCATSPVPPPPSRARDVEKVLATLGVGEAEAGDRVIEIWNKIDLVSEEDREVIDAKARRSREDRRNPAFTVSAATGEGCGALLTYLASRVDDGPAAALVLPAGDGQDAGLAPTVTAGS